MTPLEELQAAHKRLSELRSASTAGVWTVHDMDNPDDINDGHTDTPMSPVEQGWWWVWAIEAEPGYGGVMETLGRMKSVGQTAIDDHDQGQHERADADLIVTLHRTIDAQLAVLDRGIAREEVRWGADSTTLALARAINGDRN